MLDLLCFTPPESRGEQTRRIHLRILSLFCFRGSKNNAPSPYSTPSFVPQTIHRVRQRRLDRLIAHRQQRYKKGRQARY